MKNGIKKKNRQKENWGRNLLLRDISKYIQKDRNSFRKIIKIYSFYKSRWNVINDLLYMKMNEADKDIFIRFLLKRFWNYSTVEKNEIDVIEEAFQSAINAMEENQYERKYSFVFRGENIQFRLPKCENLFNNSVESRLMKHYEVVHAFFLTEYEKNGFNPTNGQVIFDCGAAHGDTSVAFSIMYPNSLIYAFEFDERQMTFLKDNIVCNNRDNVNVVKCFLYEKTGDYHIDDSFVVHEETKHDARWQRITTISIDDYVQINNIKDIGLIKMDLEGSELCVLKGAIKTIKKEKPLLYVPIYHLKSDLYKIPIFLDSLKIPFVFSIKWTEKIVWGMDCVLFVRFL